MKLNIKAFALACAIVWGLGLFLVTWWVIILDGPNTAMNELARIYRGYTVTPLGSLVGLAWAFVDGLVVGAVFAWLYNRLAVRTATVANPEPSVDTDPKA